MKKLLFVLALGAFAACGGGTSNTNGSDTTTTPTDTGMTTSPTDTSAASTMPADTSHMADTTHK